jgi:hypothetical protein
MNPSLTHVHLCIKKHSMWGFLVGYLYGLMSLFYVSLPHLLYIYITEERGLLFIIIIVLYSLYHIREVL